MMTLRNILIAFDGSPGARQALEHLKQRRAGLPKRLQALVLCVTDVWTAAMASAVGPYDLPMTETRQAMKPAERQALKEARAVALKASEELRASCPGWHVRAESCTDSPAHGIIERAEAWNADLIVLGSHGRSVAGRIVIGSVAQTVVREASCAVRVMRGRVGKRNTPFRS